MIAAMRLLLGATMLVVALCQSTQPRTAFVTFTFPTLNLTDAVDLDAFRSELYIALTGDNPPLLQPDAVRDIIVDGTAVDVGVDSTELAAELVLATSSGFCISLDELTYCGLPLGASTASPTSSTASGEFIVATTTPPSSSSGATTGLGSGEVAVIVVISVLAVIVLLLLRTERKYRQRTANQPRSDPAAKFAFADLGYADNTIKAKRQLALIDVIQTANAGPAHPPLSKFSQGLDPDATLRQRTNTPELQRHRAIKQQRPPQRPVPVVGGAVPEASFRPLPAYAALVKPSPAYGAMIKPTPVPARAKPLQNRDDSYDLASSDVEEGYALVNDQDRYALACDEDDSYALASDVSASNESETDGTIRRQTSLKTEKASKSTKASKSDLCAGYDYAKTGKVAYVDLAVIRATREARAREEAQRVAQESLSLAPSPKAGGLPNPPPLPSRPIVEDLVVESSDDEDDEPVSAFAAMIKRQRSLVLEENPGSDPRAASPASSMCSLPSAPAPPVPSSPPAAAMPPVARERQRRVHFEDEMEE
eukprot:m.51686 g.51686  ORF g.51686 m.51686 type:complete len:537 (-) comp13450_c0_seq1:176-1786(-)